MTESYVGSGSWQSTISIPTLGTRRTALSYATPLKQLADRTEYIKNNITTVKAVRTVASRAACSALAAVTGDICLVASTTKCEGLYVFLASSGRTADEYRVLTGIGGKWHLYELDNPYVQHYATEAGAYADTGHAFADTTTSSWTDVVLNAGGVSATVTKFAPTLWAGTVIVASGYVNYTNTASTTNHKIEYKALTTTGATATVDMSPTVAFEIDTTYETPILQANFVFAYTLSADATWTNNIVVTLQHRQTTGGGTNMQSINPAVLIAEVMLPPMGLL